MAENINVVARVRPFSEWIGGEKQRSSCVTIDPRTSTIFIKTPQHEKKFNVNEALDQDTKQETVYADIGQRIVDGFVGGINGTIFAYGQTGSGKTFTMLGPEAQDRASFDYQNRGVIPRAIEDVFALLDAEAEKNPNFTYRMTCSFLELYNERLYDLLQSNNDAIKIQARGDRQICVIGAAEIEVSSTSQCMDLLWRGWNQRKVAETAMNRESSRSHAVFMLSLQTETMEQFVRNRRSSRLNLVDLAGSERQAHTNNTGDRLKEASNINKSLTFLARVIRTLATSKRPEHVPYRDSQLTYLLKDSLGGNARTAVIVNIHPNRQFIGETLSTLQFAENCKKIQNTAKVNEDVSCDEIAAWKAEIERLRTENCLLKEQLEQMQTSSSTCQVQARPLIEGHQLQVLTAEERKKRRQTKFISKPPSFEAPDEDVNLEKKLEYTQEKWEEEERFRLECEIKLEQQNQILAEKDARLEKLEELVSTEMRCNSQLLAEKDARIKQLEEELASTVPTIKSWQVEEMIKELVSKNAEISALKTQNAKLTGMKAQYQALKNEKEAIQGQCDDYLNQLTEGVGHTNQAQRIQHLEKIKNDLKASKNENAKLRSLLKSLGHHDKDIASFLRSH